ncbi:MAG: ATP-binding cassette domain-containing protein [Sedimentisphaerales bacterium]|nr:ATP-binding cassette domain-containing protein [Sedimentisphaerales bacterium]
MDDNAKSIIKVENITIAYDDFVVLKDINFEVKQGEIFVILGGSGCGKSTLLKSMISLIKPVTGKVLIDGKDIVTAQGNELRDILSGIGVMYQNSALFGSMNIIENICLVLEEFTNLPKDAMELIANMRLKVVGLEGAGYKMPSELSGGMKKRAAIARAMALDPKIIFLDEPGAGLDPITSAQLDELIRKLSRSLNITFVIVTHELDSIFAIADRVIMLDKETKSIIATGNPNELRDKSTNPWVKQFFNRQAVEK